MKTHLTERVKDVTEISVQVMRALKGTGFSDLAIAKCIATSEDIVRCGSLRAVHDLTASCLAQPRAGRTA
jgi:phosphoenolpyruvate-protein kinase (PTS system EI component)